MISLLILRIINNFHWILRLGSRDFLRIKDPNKASSHCTHPRINGRGFRPEPHSAKFANFYVYLLNKIEQLSSTTVMKLVGKYFYYYYHASENVFVSEEKVCF